MTKKDTKGFWIGDAGYILGEAIGSLASAENMLGELEKPEAIQALIGIAQTKALIVIADQLARLASAVDTKIEAPKEAPF